MPVVGVGDTELEVYDGTKYIKSNVSDVLYVPDIKWNLFSVKKIVDNGYVVTLRIPNVLLQKTTTYVVWELVREITIC